MKVNCYATDRKDQPTNNQLARAANMIHYVLRWVLYQGPIIVCSLLLPQGVDVSFHSQKATNSEIRLNGAQFNQQI